MTRRSALRDLGGRAWARLLSPPRVVGIATRKLAKTFTGYCVFAGPTVLVVADKERIALMHLVGALAGLLWWWAEARVRAAWEQGRRAGMVETMTVLAEASEAVARATERRTNHM